MEEKDARSLSPAAQEVIRIRAVEAALKGMSRAKVAETFKVAPGTISKWKGQYERGGWERLKARPRGHAIGVGRKISPEIESKMRAWVVGSCPDQLRLPFALWTRQAVADLLFDRFGISMPLRSVGRYLSRWGMTPQVPVRRAYERNPTAVKNWLETEFPGIQERAKKEKAQILWGDEMGLRSEHQTGTSFAPKGKTPVVQGSGKRFGLNMLSVIARTGFMSFLIYAKNLTSEVFIDFLGRLISRAGRKIFLIVDSHPCHRSGQTRDWVAAHSGKIELFFLPGYSPDLNPDEYLNHDVKANVFRSGKPRNQRQMTAKLYRYLANLQRKKAKVRSFFQAKTVLYAA